jgi:hypothetical protein
VNDLDDVAEAKYKHYPHLTNKNDMIGPIVLDPLTSPAMWSLTIKEKKVAIVSTLVVVCMLWVMWFSVANLSPAVG